MKPEGETCDTSNLFGNPSKSAAVVVDNVAELGARDQHVAIAAENVTTNSDDSAGGESIPPAGDTMTREDAVQLFINRWVPSVQREPARKELDDLIACRGRWKART